MASGELTLRLAMASRELTVDRPVNQGDLGSHRVPKQNWNLGLRLAIGVL